MENNNSKIDIYFYCYPHTVGNTKITLFMFYLKTDNGHYLWNDHKLTLEDALIMYPPTNFNWIVIQTVTVEH